MRLLAFFSKLLGAFSRPVVCPDCGHETRPIGSYHEFQSGWHRLYACDKCNGTWEDGHDALRPPPSFVLRDFKRGDPPPGVEPPMPNGP